jgi:hypothetical protein
MKLSPPLSPPLREMSPSYFVLPPPEDLPSHQLLRELEDALQRDDELSLPSNEDEYFSHHIHNSTPDIPAYNYIHPDTYRFTSPILPLEDLTFPYDLPIKTERLPSLPPIQLTTFTSTPLAIDAHAFESQLKDEQLLEDDSSLRIDVPPVSEILPGPIYEVSPLQPGMLKANMGLAAKKYKGEKTLGRYTLRWFPFNMEDQDFIIAEELEGSVDMRLVLDWTKVQGVEKELHEMVDGLIIQDEEEEEELFPMGPPRPRTTVQSKPEQRQTPSQTQHNPHIAQIPKTPAQTLLSQVRPILPSPLSKSATDFKMLIAQRKRKATDAFTKQTGADTGVGVDRFSAFSTFLQTRGRADPRPSKRARPLVPVFPSSELDSTGNLPISPSPMPIPIPKGPEYQPAPTLPFTPTVVIPATNTPTFFTLSSLLPLIQPRPVVLARDFPYAQNTPDLVLSPSHALIFSHERRLTQTSILPGDKPLPNRDPNPLRQRISELVSSRAYDGVIILLELDPYADPSASKKHISNFRAWAMEKLAGMVQVVIARKEELVVVLTEVFERFCEEEAGRNVSIEETTEERELVLGGMNAYRAMVRLNESFLNEEMFED